MPDTYATIARIADDPVFTRRVTACAAQQEAGPDPYAWAYQYRYQVASAPGWAAAVDSWLASNPGLEDGWQEDQAVISDGMILAQVQALLAG